MGTDPLLSNSPEHNHHTRGDHLKPRGRCPACDAVRDGIEPLSKTPWENPDGSTNVDGWLAAYAKDDNTFWRTETGHIMNVVDALIERVTVTVDGIEYRLTTDDIRQLLRQRLESTDA